MEKNLSIDEKLKLYAANSVERLRELHQAKQFHDMQLKVFNAVFRDGYKRIFIRKGRKGGGTETILYLVARIIGLIPNASSYIIGPTQTAQSEIIWDNRRIHRYLPTRWIKAVNEKDKRIRLTNESFVKIEGADDPDKARGWEADIFVWDEYKDHNPLSLEACYPNLASRDGIWVVLGTPPTIEDHHYVRQEEAAKEADDWACFHWSIWDNPFLPGGHDWVKREKERYLKEGKWDTWEIEYEARYVFNARNKVLPSFDNKNIGPRESLLPLLERDKRHLKWICSIDPGYSTCFAVLFAAYNPYTAQVFFLDEVYSTKRSDNSVIKIWPEIMRKQKQLFDGKWITLYDSAAASFAVEVHAWMKERGLKAALEPTKKSPKDEDDYFRVANSLFAEKSLGVVASECKSFIKEAKNYETDDKDDYPDENNHQLDNMRYILKRIGYTQAMKQGEVVNIESNLPKAQKIQDYVDENKKNNDFIGFGGVNPGGVFGLDGGF